LIYFSSEKYFEKQPQPHFQTPSKDLFESVVELFFKVLLKCIKIIFFILKKLFLKSAHQNDSKHIKKINF
jgi:hypothetical protein